MPTALHVYRLCERCLTRQGDVADLEKSEGADCFVCSGVLDRTAEISKRAVRAARKYSFETLSVGVTMPEGIQDREDELRSVLRLQGRETIKTQAAHEVGALVASALEKRIDKVRPDLTLVANFGTGEVSSQSRSAFYYGRYTKPPGIPQRRELCGRCSGAGCPKCKNSGFSLRQSVESLLRERLAALSGSDKMTFTWLGNEDRESRVYPAGRPFMVEVKNPRKRELPKRAALRSNRGKVAVNSGKVLASKPVRLPAFRFRTLILGTSKSKVEPEAMATLGIVFRGATVRFERPHDKPVFKKVYSVWAKARGRTLRIEAELDGGLPVKRFVSGDLVSPSLSEVLKTEVRCRSFDILEVKEIGKFEFAEVARVSKKN